MPSSKTFFLSLSLLKPASGFIHTLNHSAPSDQIRGGGRGREKRDGYLTVILQYQSRPPGATIIWYCMLIISQPSFFPPLSLSCGGASWGKGKKRKKKPFEETEKFLGERERERKRVRVRVRARESKDSKTLPFFPPMFFFQHIVIQGFKGFFEEVSLLLHRMRKKRKKKIL